MSERLRTDFWVSAYLRRCGSEGCFAALLRRGAAEAGAVFVKLNRLDGTATLFAPAPQSAFEARGIERRFARAHAADELPLEAIDERLRREVGFDPDAWIVEIEDRQGRHFLDLAE